MWQGFCRTCHTLPHLTYSGVATPNAWSRLGLSQRLDVARRPYAQEPRWQASSVGPLMALALSPRPAGGRPGGIARCVSGLGRGFESSGVWGLATAHTATERFCGLEILKTKGSTTCSKSERSRPRRAAIGRPLNASGCTWQKPCPIKGLTRMRSLICWSHIFGWSPRRSDLNDEWADADLTQRLALGRRFSSILGAKLRIRKLLFARDAEMQQGGRE